MTLIQKFAGMTLDDVLATATPAEFSAWEAEKKIARETPRVLAVAPRPAPPAPTPAAPVKSRAELIESNVGLRRGLGGYVKSIATAVLELSALSDGDLAAENQRLSVQLQSSAKTDESNPAEPKPERLRPAEAPKLDGKMEMMRDTTSRHAQAVMSGPLTLTEKCMIENGMSEKEARERRMPMNVVGCVSAEGSLTHRVFRSKGFDTSKPQAVSRV
jgi:hypothetical protein